MQYLGGKSRIAKKLAAIINPIRGNRPFWDPFCGGLSMSVALGGCGFISDAHPALISLYRAVTAGWWPPRSVTRAEYEMAKSLPDTNPLKAFIGFGCSFGGKWFGGYASKRLAPVGGGKQSYFSYVDSARRSVMKDVAALVNRGCTFAALDFLSVEPAPTDYVLYLDPPYAGTTGYSLPFDHALFYDRVKQWATFTDVFVSEYNMPFGDVVWGAEVRCRTSNDHTGMRTERLYRVCA